MQVYELPPNWDGHPNHAHGDNTEEAGQEEVYIPLRGSATLVAGDEQAFVQLTSSHRRALHVHVYRMLGSLHDAADALQETLLRAWRGLPRYEPSAELTSWLHRIATNVALRMLEQRKPTEPLDMHLQPYPDRFLDELPTPEEQTLARERLGLAYVAGKKACKTATAWSGRQLLDVRKLRTFYGDLGSDSRLGAQSAGLSPR